MTYNTCNHGVPISEECPKCDEEFDAIIEAENKIKDVSVIRPPGETPDVMEEVSRITHRQLIRDKVIQLENRLRAQAKPVEEKKRRSRQLETTFIILAFLENYKDLHFSPAEIQRLVNLMYSSQKLSDHSSVSQRCKQFVKWGVLIPHGFPGENMRYSFKQWPKIYSFEEE